MMHEPAIEHEQTATSDMDVFITDDKMHVVLWCNPCAIDPDVIVAELAEQIETLGSVVHPGYDRLRAQLRWCAEHGRSAVKLRVASGTFPTPPRHGEIAWGGNFFQEGFYVHPETGVMDYRRPLAERTVAAGQLLATLVAPIPGAEGMTVLGAPISPEPALPAQLKAGENVEADEAGELFRATASGRVRLTDGTLHVDDVYCIEGSIGLATGNVDHPGALEVRGDIEAGSVVKAKGDIDVSGVIEDAQIECEGSLSVAGGIVGDKEIQIRAKGSVRAKFMKNAWIEAEGDIEAERSLDNCVLKCRGSVRVPKGRIVGGAVTALGGIVVHQAGSVAAVPTHLTAGEDFRLSDQRKELEKSLQSYTEGLARLHEVIDPMRGHEKQLTSSQRSTLTLLLSKESEFKEHRVALQKQLDTMLEESRQRAKHTIVVLGLVCPDTLFRIHGLAMKTAGESKGPLQVIVQEDDLLLVPHRATPPAAAQTRVPQ